jgi:hypothetical protein
MIKIRAATFFGVLGSQFELRTVIEAHMVLPSLSKMDTSPGHLVGTNLSSPQKCSIAAAF